MYEITLTRRTPEEEREYYTLMLAELMAEGRQKDARIAELESLVASLADRCEKQSQLLARRADKSEG
jgi:hypothetical protein